MDKVFFVDLAEFTLADSEGKSTQWVHAMPLGKFKHPLHGMIEFTAERVQRFASNVLNRVRGIDLAIDYGHNSGGEAAGWIQAAEARDNGLWLLVEWTKEAAERIRNREFRYFSPEFADEWADAKGNKFKDVLFGGGLTNRPFLKDLVPVVMSELEEEDVDNKEENMDFMERLRQTLGLDEDATEDEILAAAVPPKEEEAGSDSEEEEEETSSLASLIETDPHVKALADEVAELRAENRLARVTNRVADWTKNAKGKYALSEPAAKMAKSILLSVDKKTGDEISELIGEILSKGVVPLGETNSKTRSASSGESATALFDKRMSEIQEANPDMSAAEAYSEAFRDEELFEAYRREVTKVSTMEEDD